MFLNIERHLKLMDSISGKLWSILFRTQGQLKHIQQWQRGESKQNDPWSFPFRLLAWCIHLLPLPSVCYQFIFTKNCIVYYGQKNSLRCNLHNGNVTRYEHEKSGEILRYLNVLVFRWELVIFQNHRQHTNIPWRSPFIYMTVRCSRSTSVSLEYLFIPNKVCPTNTM